MLVDPTGFTWKKKGTRYTIPGTYVNRSKTLPYSSKIKAKVSYVSQ